MNEPVSTDSDLERYLEREFPFVTAIVVKNEGLSGYEMNREWGVSLQPICGKSSSMEISSEFRGVRRSARP